MIENLRITLAIWTHAFGGESDDALWQNRERVSAA